MQKRLLMAYQENQIAHFNQLIVSNYTLNNTLLSSIGNIPSTRVKDHHLRPIQEVYRVCLPREILLHALLQRSLRLMALGAKSSTNGHRSILNHLEVMRHQVLVG
jgi:hypothetical protein